MCVLYCILCSFPPIGVTQAGGHITSHRLEPIFYEFDGAILGFALGLAFLPFPLAPSYN